MMKIKLIPDIDKNNFLVSFGQTIPGKLLLLLLFLPGALTLGNVKFILPVLLVTTFFPILRKHVLAFFAIGIFFFRPQLILQASDTLFNHIPEVILAALFWVFFYYVVKRFPKFWPTKRPIVLLLISIFSFSCITYYVPFSPNIKAFLWTITTILMAYVWHFAYSLLDVQNKKTSKLAYQAGHYFPVWGGTNTPYAKGAAYLRRIEAKNSKELAITQLKAIKLFYWAFVLNIFGMLLNAFFYGDFYHAGITKYLEHSQLSFIIDFFKQNNLNALKIDVIFKAYIAGNPYSTGTAWVSIICSFLSHLVIFSVGGHQIIAVCRMIGYRALRNTYKPLASRSIADFWNRYYYYFKELLVDVYFYPAFLRYFKKHPRLRLFFATFCAAGIGNFIYHYFLQTKSMMALGPLEALWNFRHYLTYCLILSVAIGLSQVFNQKKNKNKKKNILAKLHFIMPLIPLTFFMLIFAFGSLGEISSEKDRFLFFLTLFGV